MRFLIRWLPHQHNASVEERATVCELRIEVSERNVCAYRDLDTNKYCKKVVLPAVHLAEGIASNWWKIFGGRDISHRILPWRTGFALPDLSFEFDGARFVVSCRPLETANPALLFFESANERLTRAEAERELRKFVDSVVSKLVKENVNESEVQSAWARIGRTMEDAHEQAFCEAAGALGIDPYAISNADASFIEQSAQLFAHEPLLEFLAGVCVHASCAPGDRVKLLDWIRRLEHRYSSRLPELSAIKEQVNRQFPVDTSPSTETGLGARPWIRGYQAASAFREAIGLTETQTVSVKKVASRLGGARFSRTKAPSEVYAVVARQENDIHVHLRDRGNQMWAKNAETFAFARAIGDAVLSPETPLSIVNRLHKAERQAEGRAFAAEFVAPREVVLGMYQEGRDVDEIAGLLEVNPKIVDHHIENSIRQDFP